MESKFQDGVEISNVNITTSSLNIKQVPIWVVNIPVQMFRFSYIAYPLPVIVWRICLFNSFEKLSMLLGFLRYVGRVGEWLLHISSLESWTESGVQICTKTRLPLSTL